MRRVAHGVGVERTFMLHSPRLEKIEVTRHGKVRRARRFPFGSTLGNALAVLPLFEEGVSFLLRRTGNAYTFSTSRIGACGSAWCRPACFPQSHPRTVSCRRGLYTCLPRHRRMVQAPPALLSARLRD
jgi:hypothetical protein